MDVGGKKCANVHRLKCHGLGVERQISSHLSKIHFHSTLLTLYFIALC